MAAKPEFPPLPAFPIKERGWGKEFHDRHPVLRHPDGGNSAGYGKRLAEKFTPEQLEAMVPRQVAGCYYSRCPHCKKGGEAQWTKHWRWTEDRPEEMVCKHCGTVFPNERYPLSEKRTYLNPAGEEIVISFYRAPDGEEHFLDALLDMMKDSFLRRSLIHLGYAYHETKDEKTAEAGLAILRGYARSMPHWLTYGATGWGAPRHKRGYMSTGGPYMRNGKPIQPSPRDPYAWEEGRGPYFSWWFRSMQGELYRAYDLLYKSKLFKGARSPDGKHSLRFWIENSTLDNQAEYMLAYPWPAHIKNNLPLHVSDLCKVAMVCGRPQYARFARDWCKHVFYNYDSGHDMVTSEGPGYHYCWIAHARPTYSILGQYEDPPGYRDAQGISLAGFDPREEPAKRRQFWGVSMMRYPDGSIYPIGDTHRRGKGWTGRPLRRSVNRIAPGFGLTVLGDGSLRGGDQVQVILSWNGGTHSHSHEDVHNLLLFANGRELFSDAGGIWDARQTIAHNTVSIDRKDNGKINGGRTPSPAGSLELFTPNLPGVAVARVEGKMAAYSEETDGIKCERYRRTLVHNTVDLDHPYVLDIFEVRGGRLHEYFLQGSLEKEFPQKGSCSLELADYSKPAPEDPENLRGWDGFGDLKSSPITEAGHVDFVFVDRQDLGTRTHFQRDEEMQLILGEAPNFRFAKVGYGRNKRSDMPADRTVPKLILRHKGNDGLSTDYVLVHEVLNGEGVVRGLEHQISDDGVLSVEVDLGDRRDYYAVALERPGKLRSGPLSAEGVFAAAVTRNGKCDLWMAGATEASCMDRTLTNTRAAFTGSVDRVARMEDGAPRDAYLSDAPLPVGDALVNEMAMLEFFDEQGELAFTLSSEIEEVLADGDRRWVTIRQDAGVIKHEDGAWEEIFYPYRRAAACRLKVVTSSTTVARLQWTPCKGRYSPFEVNDFVAVDDSTKVTVLTGNVQAPITVSGGPSARGNGRVELCIDRDAELVLEAANPGGVMTPRRVPVRFVTRRPARSVDPAPLAPGIPWKRYKGRVDLKDASSLSLMEEGVSEDISDFRCLGRNQSMVFEGYLRAPRSGKYRFFSRQAGGAKLFVDDLQILDTANYERDEEFAADICLEKGLHRIRYDFGHHRETGLFHLKWSGPGLDKQVIPESALFHDRTGRP